MLGTWDFEYNIRYVRAVRGTAIPTPTATPTETPVPGNFIDNGDGTITNTQRGLTWEKKGVSYNDWGSTGGGPGSHDARARYVWAGLCNDNRVLSARRRRSEHVCRGDRRRRRVRTVRRRGHVPYA
jgi:hypothetical protein